MLIGIISDTHIPDKSVKLPKTVFDAFKDVELIIHAGDITNMCVIESLEELAPVLCVQGNIDRLEGLDLPKTKTITIDGVKIGIIHGEVFPKGDTQQLKYIAKELGVDVLITGHTHKPFIGKEEDIIILCPGSPTYPRLSDSTVMIMEVKEGEVNLELVKVNPPVCKALKFKK